MRFSNRLFPKLTATLRTLGTKAGEANASGTSTITVHMQPQDAQLITAPMGKTPITIRKCYTFATTDVFEGDMLKFTVDTTDTIYQIFTVRRHHGTEKVQRFDLEALHVQNDQW